LTFPAAAVWACIQVGDLFQMVSAARGQGVRPGGHAAIQIAHEGTTTSGRAEEEEEKQKEQAEESSARTVILR
jgi:ribosomal protein L12E/L44/L45/RPP1/RPP2